MRLQATCAALAAAFATLAAAGAASAQDVDFAFNAAATNDYVFRGASQSDESFALSGGVGGIVGSLIGAFLMSVLSNGCTLTGIPNYVQEILIGAIIVAARESAVDREPLRIVADAMLVARRETVEAFEW